MMITRRSLLMLAAAAITGTAMSVMVLRTSRAGGPIAPRTIEARLSGQRWAPLQRAAAREQSSGVRAAGLIAPMAVTTSAGDDQGARHAAAIASLLAGNSRKALAILASSARSSTDPRVWSDYAAACYAASSHYEAPEMLAEALAAADTALRFAPALEEGLFNRALAIERLGLRDQARRAWEQYLLVDSGSEWAIEARQRVSRLGPELQFKEILDRDYDSLSRNAAETAALARRFTQQARTFGEARILARWAAAAKDADNDAAAQHLTFARNLGAEVKRINGDAMLARGVAAIDRADEARRNSLIAAHLELSAGHDAFNAAGYAEAEKRFRAAAFNFANGDSPIAHVARYYSANAVFEQGRRSEARKILEQLLSAADPAFPALRAQVLWEMGLCYAADGEWGEMLRAQLESIAIFERLGETGHAAILHSSVAAAYDRIGQRESAWKHRVTALRHTGRHTTFRLQQALSGIAEAAILEQNWRTAAAFLNLEVEIGRHMGNVLGSADGLLIRAKVRQRLNDIAGAQADVAEARALIGGITDAAAYARIEARYAAVKAVIDAQPAEAVTLLTRALEYESTNGYRMFLPSLYLQRARAHRAGGDVSTAARDVERGIRELEAHRESLPPGETRWGVFFAADSLFEEGIELALLRKDVNGAFATVERARARSLLDLYGPVTAPNPAHVAPETVVVEYAVLPSKLVIFTVDTAGVSAVEVPCRRERLANEVDAFVRALRDDDARNVRTRGMALYDLLIEPVASKLSAATTVVFVADGELTAIPFAALVDRTGAYLLERHTITVAPSASVFASAAKRHRARSIPARVLIVSRSAAAAGSGSLRFVEREAQEIASLYPAAVHLNGTSARMDTIATEGATSDAIHFGGHAVGDSTGLEPAAIVLSDRTGRESRANVAQIATLPLRTTSVVVLAGCSTAVGERRSAEGALSVARGFLAAGAPSVIATLWPIDDEEAAVFFPRLHGHLAAGLAPAEALRRTQMELMHRPSASTALWAAVQNIGN
jgi:CHAT domain-containing protein